MIMDPAFGVAPGFFSTMQGSISQTKGRSGRDFYTPLTNIWKQGCHMKIPDDNNIFS